MKQYSSQPGIGPAEESKLNKQPGFIQTQSKTDKKPPKAMGTGSINFKRVNKAIRDNSASSDEKPQTSETATADHYLKPIKFDSKVIDTMVIAQEFNLNEKTQEN